MRKLFIVILTLLMLGGISANSMAKPSPKSTDVSLIGPAAAVKPGETVTLTAVTLKHGSDFIDEWVGATKIETVLTEDGYYISTAEITTQVPVTVQYKITMTAGNSEVFFTGQAETIVSVVKSAEVVGAEVKNICPVPETAGIYKGDVYCVLSDGTLNQCGSVYFILSESQTSKLLYITVDGIRFSCLVTVTK